MDTQLTMHAALGTDGMELLSIDNDRKTGRCTGACLGARQNLRVGILDALAESLGTRRVAQAFGVSREVVRALKKQALESGELDQHKQRLGLDALALASATIDRISDELDDMPKASLPIIAGVMIDKAQLLTGGPTMRTVHEQHLLVDINALVEALPVIDLVPSAPVDEGEKTQAKGIDAVVLELSGDSPSPALPLRQEEKSADGSKDGHTPPQKVEVLP